MFREIEIISENEVIDEVKERNIVMERDERKMRRKEIKMEKGEKIIEDFDEKVVMEKGERMVIDEGREIEIREEREEIYEIRGREKSNIEEIEWKIGKRNMEEKIEKEKILIMRDNVIRVMIEGIGEKVNEVVEILSKLRGD